MKISIVIPTFNRAGSVVQAARSALDAFADANVPIEIVIVDDCSTDDTSARVASSFGVQLVAGTIRYLANAVNLGVTGSKNNGYLAASGDWVIFLDSDDTLVEQHGGEAVDALRRHAAAPIIFFRCVDETGVFVGQQFSHEVTLDLETYLQHTSFGEALTAINKRLVAGAPYIEALRGYEGLGCCRIIHKHGSAVLSNVVARRYDRRGEDRLSASSGYLRRLPLLARGHRQMLAEFGAMMTPRKRWGYRLKAAVYQLVGGAYRRVALGRFHAGTI